MLRLAFETKCIRYICENEERAKSKFGEHVAAALRHRIADLGAAQSAADIFIGNPRVVDRGGILLKVLDLCDGWRLVFQANHPNNPVDDAGNLIWERVTRIKIVAIERENA